MSKASSTSTSSPSSTSRPARSGAVFSRRSLRRSEATTFAPRGCSAGSTSTSCFSSTSTGSSAVPTASTCSRSRRTLAAARRHAAHRASEPTPHQAQVLTELCEQAEPRHRDDRDCAAAARRVRRLPARRRSASCRTAPRARLMLAVDEPGFRGSPRRARRATGFLLSTFGLISPGKGLETVIEALPAILERHPEVVYLIAGPHPSRLRAARGRALPVCSSGACSSSGSATTSSSTTASSRSTSSRTAGCDRRLRDSVPQPRADRLRRADLRARGRLRRGLDAVLVRAGHARLGRRPPRAVRRSGGAAEAVCGYVEQPETACRGAGGGAADRVVARLAVGCRGDRGVLREALLSLLGAGRRASQICI